MSCKSDIEVMSSVPHLILKQGCVAVLHSGTVWKTPRQEYLAIKAKYLARVHNIVCGNLAGVTSNRL
jgi:hypothetical protein